MLIGHALGWHGVLAAHVLLLHVLLVGHLLLLFRGNVVGLGRHATATRHVRLRRGDLRVIDVFRGLDVRFAVNTVLAALWRLGRVEASLRTKEVREVEVQEHWETLPV